MPDTAIKVISQSRDIVANNINIPTYPERERERMYKHMTRELREKTALVNSLQSLRRKCYWLWNLFLIICFHDEMKNFSKKKLCVRTHTYWMIFDYPEKKRKQITLCHLITPYDVILKVAKKNQHIQSEW